MAKITLSFDNGPDPEVTPRVLDILARHGIAATFFVIGEKLAAPGGRELAERARADGHWIGNHTYTHGTPLGEDRSADAPEREIGATQALMQGLANERKLFRPFGGGGHLDSRVLSQAARDYLAAGGYTCVLWNSVPGDWKDADWAVTAKQQVASQPWSLVVLHDIPGACIEGLDGYLSELEDDGHEFVKEFPPDCVPMESGRLLRPEVLPEPAF